MNNDSPGEQDRTISEGEPLVFISAAEPSGDQHAAALIRATCRKRPGARFVGVAGPEMVAAGCESIFDMTRHAAMALGAISQIGRAMRMLRTSRRCLRSHPFAAAVVIDSPVLHLPLARRARAAGVPVMYYIAPQTWAWDERRVRQLRNGIDRVGVILPFEEDYFRGHGVNATFVGHPLGDRLANAQIDETLVAELRQSGDPVVALLPGSRGHVVREVLRGQLEAAERIQAAFPKAIFPVSIAHEQVREPIEKLTQQCHANVRTHAGRHLELIQAADLVLVASGTITLEVAMLATPMIVMYNASRVFYHLVARHLVRLEHLSLPNILAKREVVPEFMPYYTSTEPIAARAIELLGSEEKRHAMTDELRTLTAPLHAPGASDRAADLLLELVHGVTGRQPQAVPPVKV